MIHTLDEAVEISFQERIRRQIEPLEIEAAHALRLLQLVEHRIRKVRVVNAHWDLLHDIVKRQAQFGKAKKTNSK